MKKVFGTFLALGFLWLASGASEAAIDPAIQINSESGSTAYFDFKNGLDATYLVFQIANTGANNYGDVWVELVPGAGLISDVGNSFHQLKFKPATGAHDTVATPNPPIADLGLSAGQTKGVFFLVRISAALPASPSAQSFTVNVYNNASLIPANLIATAPFNFTPADTIQANANKVTTVITIPTNPQIGQLGDIRVTGCTGTVGAAKVLYFSPVSSHTWPSDSFEFIDSDILINGYPTLYRDIALIPPGDVLTNVTCSQNSSGTGSYDEVFTFVIDAVGSANTSPANFISSGTQVKHTTNTSGSFQVVIPVTCQSNPVTVSANPTTLPDGAQNDVYAGATFSAVEAGRTGCGTVFTFSAPAGLPAGLNLDPNTGVLSGTPTVCGTFNIAILAHNTDCVDAPTGCEGVGNFNLTITCAGGSVVQVPTLGYPALALLALALAGTALLLIRRT